MADNPTPDLDVPETASPAGKPKRKGIKRRIFLAGSALVVGGGIFGVWWTDRGARSRGNELIGGEGKQSFNSVMTIAEDDTVTLFSPHIDFGQGSHTALGQMLADELDADWNKVKIEQAPADLAFANALLEELVLVVPGTGFSDPGWFRIAYCVDTAVIERSFAGFATLVTEDVGFRPGAGSSWRMALARSAWLVMGGETFVG